MDNPPAAAPRNLKSVNDKRPTDEILPVGVYAVIAAGDLASEAGRVAALCADQAITAVMIRPPESITPEAAQALCEAVSRLQADGIAVLVERSIELAKATASDGLHVPWSTSVLADFKDARAALGPAALVGADAGKSRHDAMQLGEAGANYIAFGIPDFVRDRETAARRQAELVAWWAEIFEIPVVATDIEDFETAGRLARAGADFLAIALPSLSSSEQDMMAWKTALAASLRARQPAPHGE